MRTPLSWLRDFAPIDVDADDLVAVLDSLGLVVEGVERVGEGLEDVVVSRVLAIEPIPGADKIRKVTVDAGGEPVSVVCGAWNFAVGDLVPLAPVGALLPGGLSIGRRRMKGVASEGMLCSGKELGLSEDASGILVLGAAGAEPGAALGETLGVERDVVFDLAIETNRPDAMSIAGVARDVAARLRVPFSIPEPVIDEGPPAADETASLELAAAELCPRITARVVLGVTVGDSPAWIARRLLLAGMRPLNTVVDASNYVMLELGQPTHPYDLDLLGGGGLLVRRAEPGEKIVTLDGEQRVLGTGGDAGGDCLICDAEGRPVGIGGIMGGSSSEIIRTTSRVMLEAAYFSPMAISRTAMRTGLRTEASARFERGTDPEGIERAAARVCELLASPGPPVPSGSRPRIAAGLLDRRGELPGPVEVPLRTARASALLGVELSAEALTNLLEPIGFAVAATDAGSLRVTVPTFRPDSFREVDVIEEIARHYGYENIPRSVPAVTQTGSLSAYQRARRSVRSLLVGLGLSEAWTPSLIGPGDDDRAGFEGAGIEVENPLAREESVLRRSLLPGMMKAVRFNLSRRQSEVSFFEIGHVFGWPEEGQQLPRERELLGIGLAGGDGAPDAVRVWRALAEMLRLEGVSLEASSGPGLHPGRCAEAVEQSSGSVLGVVGEVDPGVLEAFELDQWVRRVGWIEVDLGLVLAARRRSEIASPVSRYPSTDIDLAFVVEDSATAGQVEETLIAAGGGLLERIWLFDVYRGESVGGGRRSLAYRLRFCALDRTLTDSEVAEVRRGCIEAVESSLPARLR